MPGTALRAVGSGKIDKLLYGNTAPWMAEEEGGGGGGGKRKHVHQPQV